ncbi:MAG: GcrA cell cycle regulator [Rhodospirillaceae bacterium]|nr:MAG: GcrA cell cycle regulator [Rhodospirillaceae bacterium]
MEWTEQRIETLRKLWGQGQTASQIAAILGGITRNAVIGKAHRLGLTGRPSPIKREAGSGGTSQPRRKAATARQDRPERARPAMASTAPSPMANRVPAGTVGTGNTGASPAAPQPSAAPVRPAAEMHRQSAGGLPLTRQAQPSRAHGGSKNCSWPVGDPKQPGFHFCGEPAEPGRPYCAEHCHVAYHRKSEAA